MHAASADELATAAAGAGFTGSVNKTALDEACTHLPELCAYLKLVLQSSTRDASGADRPRALTDAEQQR